MKQNGRLQRFIAWIRRGLQKIQPWNGTSDMMGLKLFGLKIDLSRRLPPDIPYELTVVVPRAELRGKCNCPEGRNCEWEVILSSITIAHSPREIGKTGAASPPRIPRK